MMEYVLIPIKTKPSYEPEGSIGCLISDREDEWLEADLKTRAFKFGAYLAFEVPANQMHPEGMTYLYKVMKA